MQKVYGIYDRVGAAMREYLNHHNFMEYKANLLGPVTDPGIRGSKQVKVDYYGWDYKIMSSAILYKQLLAIGRKKSGFPGKIYFFADNLRLEPPETAHTDRHLAEFIQVDLELTDEDHFGAMEVAEELLTHICDRMTEREELHEIWDFFESFWEERGLRPRRDLDVPTTPFKKYTYKEAVDMVRHHVEQNPEVLDRMREMFGVSPRRIDHSTELHWEYEWLLSHLHDEPFFIYGYPRGSRGFYDREYPEKPGLLMDFDLVFPQGYGEAASGAAREFDHGKVIGRMKETGEKLEKYGWYLRFLKEHGTPTAGFGIGLERTVRYVCALPSIFLAIPYPKIPAMYSP
jgi:asparaginyl-tRNA synthetase